MGDAEGDPCTVFVCDDGSGVVADSNEETVATDL